MPVQFEEFQPRKYTKRDSLTLALLEHEAYVRYGPPRSEYILELILRTLDEKNLDRAIDLIQRDISQFKVMKKPRKSLNAKQRSVLEQKLANPNISWRKCLKQAGYSIRSSCLDKGAFFNSDGVRQHLQKLRNAVDEELR